MSSWPTRHTKSTAPPRPEGRNGKWPASETRCRPATGEEAPGQPPGWSWAPEAGEEPGAAGRAGSPGRKGCTSSQWRRERGPWPSTTPSPSDRTASRSTGLCSSSARTTW
ncbi:calcium voltage-gated channel subunit alpha1 A [Rhinolophus ferrumequinum]|uniref:Calcium voltage-gated channel subunit alpha1 A n=1 Tax=Rhinolophus ferrumequinum TaxID=59479 RepID=A0A7J7TZ38_RHIFE|nr:calcium voltage-gated channel subunit alpha1 A [Rhinolophus ferrumequinum]